MAGMDGARPVSPGMDLKRDSASRAAGASVRGIRRRLLLATTGAAGMLFLCGGAAAAVQLGPRQGPSQPGGTQLPKIRYVVTDSRHPASLERGRFFLAQGAERLEVADGLTRLWKEALAPLWRGQDSGAVAGLTTVEVWHCLSEQARGEWHASHLLQRHRLGADQPTPLVSWFIE